MRKRLLEAMLCVCLLTENPPLSFPSSPPFSSPPTLSSPPRRVLVRPTLLSSAFCVSCTSTRAATSRSIWTASRSSTLLPWGPWCRKWWLTSQRWAVWNVGKYSSYYVYELHSILILIVIVHGFLVPRLVFKITLVLSECLRRPVFSSSIYSFIILPLPSLSFLTRLRLHLHEHILPNKHSFIDWLHLLFTWEHHTRLRKTCTYKNLQERSPKQLWW